MFGLKKQENSCEQDAHRVYIQLLERVREPHFYADLGVPDTFEGRFDLLSLHVFMVMDVALEHEQGDIFNQALFDTMFANMDQALRQSGKGDMGVPKHMRRMMKGFNGRVQRYHNALGSAASFKESMAANLNVEKKAHLDTLYKYVRSNMTHLKTIGLPFDKKDILLPLEG